MIKIYINNFNININDISNIIEKINTISNISKSYIEYYIYSKTGIYIVYYNSICKIEKKDITPEKIILNNREIIIDKSSDIIQKNTYQIPIEHKIYKQKINQYKINSKSKISFIIEEIEYNNYKPKIINYYFTLVDSENINHIEEELDTFLSVLN